MVIISTPEFKNVISELLRKQCPLYTSENWNAEKLQCTFVFWKIVFICNVKHLVAVNYRGDFVLRIEISIMYF